jgi:ferredoxin
MTGGAGARLSVDPIACDGRGLCAELLPGLITLDDWGFPMIAAREVPARLRRHAEAAVRLCPRLALRLNLPSHPVPPDVQPRRSLGITRSWTRTSPSTPSTSPRRT